MKRTEHQAKREALALIGSAKSHIESGEGYYGIAESCLKRALECLDEASERKLEAKGIKKNKQNERGLK